MARSKRPVKHAAHVSGCLSFTYFQREHAGHAPSYLLLQHECLLMFYGLRQLGSRSRVTYLPSMLGMLGISKATYDRTSTYDGIMLKFRKNVSMLIKTFLHC